MNDDDTILQTLLQGVVGWADWAISFIIDLPPDCALDRHGRSVRLRCVACAAGCLEVVSCRTGWNLPRLPWRTEKNAPEDAK